ncbi:MAG: prephenate dehydratase [Nitrospinota bacterium]|nr:prephenate dehydratase [Nitrospinota bacterium]
MVKESIGDIREKIDKLDEKLVRILNQRAKLGVRIAEIKATTGAPVFHPAREKQILGKVADMSKGPLSAEAVQNVFSEIFSATRSVEKNMKIACLGPAGSFSHLAVARMFGASCQSVLEPGIDRVFMAVQNGAADLGVVPIENSIEGAVGQTMDLLASSSVKVHAECFYDIHLCLMSKEANRERVNTVFSQYMPLGQCRGWLARNMAGVKIVETASTAEAAARAAREPGSAAIGAEKAAEIYGLSVLASNIEDRAGNQTRFLAISRDGAPKPGANKTSIVFSTRHEAGALFKALQPFAEKKINLLGIQSRPSPVREWEYVFFMDFLGSMDSAPVKWAMNKMEPFVAFIKPLGSYPAAMPVAKADR